MRKVCLRLVAYAPNPSLRRLLEPDRSRAGGSRAGLPSVWDLLVSYVLPAVAILVFWKHRSPTPGKLFMSAEIVDALSRGKPSTRQLVLRYLGYHVSTVPLLLGLDWVAGDSRKQGWHDKLAGTVVVSTVPAGGTERYAPTSALTYLLCVPILLAVLALVIVLVGLALNPGLLPTALRDLR